MKSAVYNAKEIRTGIFWVVITYNLVGGTSDSKKYIASNFCL